MAVIGHGLRGTLRKAKRWFFPETVEAVNVAVTSRCNCRCLMCDFGGRRGGRDMPLVRVEALCESLAGIHLRSFFFTGGEPFLHPDLAAMAEAVRRRIPRARLGFSTNGLLTARIADLASRLAPGVRVVVSVDGRRRHDRIRGRRGALDRALATLRALSAVDGVAVSGAFTLGPWNVDDLVPSLHWARAEGFSLRVKVVEDLRSYNTFRSKGLKAPRFTLSSRDRRAMAEALAEAAAFYEAGGEADAAEYARLVSRELPRGEHVFAHCPVQSHCRFVTVDGRVFGCRNHPHLARLTDEGLVEESGPEGDGPCGECYSPLAFGMV